MPLSFSCLASSWTRFFDIAVTPNPYGYFPSTRPAAPPGPLPLHPAAARGRTPAASPPARGMRRKDVATPPVRPFAPDRPPRVLPRSAALRAPAAPPRPRTRCSSGWAPAPTRPRLRLLRVQLAPQPRLFLEVHADRVLDLTGLLDPQPGGVREAHHVGLA